jgi:hypothetical protein
MERATSEPRNWLKAGRRACRSVTTRWTWFDMTQKAWTSTWKRSAATARRKPKSCLVASEGRSRNWRCVQRRVTR